jgi:hypothetical protein
VALSGLEHVRRYVRSWRKLTLVTNFITSVYARMTKDWGSVGNAPEQRRLLAGNAAPSVLKLLVPRAVGLPVKRPMSAISFFQHATSALPAASMAARFPERQALSILRMAVSISGLRAGCGPGSLSGGNMKAGSFLTNFQYGADAIRKRRRQCWTVLVGVPLIRLLVISCTLMLTSRLKTQFRFPLGPPLPLRCPCLGLVRDRPSQRRQEREGVP